MTPSEGKCSRDYTDSRLVLIYYSQESFLSYLQQALFVLLPL